MKLAQSLEANRNYEGAAQEFVRTDDLVSRAAAVRVSLALPEDYGRRKRAVFDAVIDSTLEQADRLTGEGRYEQAAAAYRKAIARYQPSAKQRSRADAGLFAALMAGAESEMEALRQDFKNLEVPFGASYAEIKSAYKGLLRRYHPDKHANDPEKLKSATEVTKKINASFLKLKKFYKKK